MGVWIALGSVLTIAALLANQKRWRWLSVIGSLVFVGGSILTVGLLAIFLWQPTLIFLAELTVIMVITLLVLAIMEAFIKSVRQKEFNQNAPF